MGGLKAAANGLFRWYLREFPLTDGKAYFFELLNNKLSPDERYVIIRIDNSFNMRLDLSDPVQRKMYFFGDYDERYEARLIRQVLEPGEVFWDIGANIGFFSLVAASVLNNTGRVAAFEPGELTFESLTKNIEINVFKNIDAFKLAVTDREGEATLYSSRDRADGLANIYAPKEGQTQSQSCRTVFLDKFSPEMELKAPHFIKMDVEGAELAALQGAEEVIRRAQPLLLIEMKAENLQMAGTDKAQIPQLLAPYGYRPAFLSRGQWQATEDLGALKSRNIFWFNPSVGQHRKKAARIPLKGNY
jgi:FkbM family methyltransferase